MMEMVCLSDCWFARFVAEATRWISIIIGIKKGKVIPLQARCGPEGG